MQACRQSAQHHNLVSHHAPQALVIQCIPQVNLTAVSLFYVVDVPSDGAFLEWIIETAFK